MTSRCSGKEGRDADQKRESGGNQAYWMQCIDAFSLLLQRYVMKGKCKERSNSELFFVMERTQLTIQLLELQEIWQNNSSETMWMTYRRKSEFWRREFLTI